MGRLFCVAAVSSVAALVFAISALAQQSALVPFEIKDQFDRVHRHSDYSDRILIVIGSDREGSQFHDEWESTLRDSLATKGGAEEIAYLSVADVRGVPFFIKGTVKGRFSREEDEWILLDWKGLFAKAYSFEPNSANVLVFVPNGTLAAHVHGRELDFEVMSAILVTVRRLRAGTYSPGT